MTVAEPAIERLSSGRIAGVPLQLEDPILNTRWIGDSANFEINGDPTHAQVWVVVDGTGHYTATAYRQDQGTTCLRRLGWSGKLYKVGARLYAAWNYGADHYYLVNVSLGYQSLIASSVSDELKGLSERTELLRNDRAELDLLTQMLEQARCPQD